MTSATEFDRVVANWLETAGPLDLHREAVEDALRDARGTPQRRGRRAWLLGPASWPVYGRRRGPSTLSPAVRLAMVAMLLIGLLAVVAVGAGSLRGLLADATPSRPPAPTLVVGDSYVPIYLRETTIGDGTFIDAILVMGDGTERVVRRLDTELDGAEFPLGPFGSVSRDGWLAVGTTSEGQLPLAAYALMDLADPLRAPLVVEYPPVVGGRWSQTNLFALSSVIDRSETGWMAIAIVDPRTAARTELGVVSLFGGGPSIVWASDASGILDSARLQPVAGGPDVLIPDGLLFDDPRVGSGGRTAFSCDGTEPDEFIECANATGPVVRVVEPGRGDLVEWYAVPGDNGRLSGEIFFAPSADPLLAGRSLLVLVERADGPRRRAEIVRVDAPGEATTVATVDLPAGGFGPYLRAIAPDASSVAVGYWSGPEANPTLAAPIFIAADGSITPGPSSGTFIGFVKGPEAASWPTWDAP